MACIGRVKRSSDQRDDVLPVVLSARTMSSRSVSATNDSGAAPGGDGPSKNGPGFVDGFERSAENTNGDAVTMNRWPRSRPLEGAVDPASDAFPPAKRIAL